MHAALSPETSWHIQTDNWKELACAKSQNVEVMASILDFLIGLSFSSKQTLKNSKNNTRCTTIEAD